MNGFHARSNLVFGYAIVALSDAIGWLKWGLPLWLCIVHTIVFSSLYYVSPRVTVEQRAAFVCDGLLRMNAITGNKDEMSVTFSLIDVRANMRQVSQYGRSYGPRT
jgi:hypothetical protein